jgi:ribosomal protein S18 acetylase RimI-like enzyme
VTPRRATPEDLPATLPLIQSAFGFMDRRIDPPSSMHRLTIDDLAESDVWVIGAPPLACIVLTPKADALYLGKLAVASSERGKGHARTLIDQAETRARELGLSALELQTRIELTENQRTFEAMGFTELARTAHEGYNRPTSITYRRPL